MKFKKKCKILIIELIMLIMLLVSAAMVNIVHDDMKHITKSEYYDVNALVVKAEHIPAKSYYYSEISNGLPVTILKHDPDKYNVVIKYDDIVKEYHDITMYNKCKARNRIPIQICVLTTGNKTETKITDIY